MPGRTLREAIAVALEVVPSVELAAGNARSRETLRSFLLGWIKEYAFHRGVIFEDHDLEGDLRDVIEELRAAAAEPSRVDPARDDESRCAVCGWTLVTTLDDGCVRGNCSQRPRPERLYAPDRARAEGLA